MGGDTRTARRVAVWDLPVRLFHWSLVVLVVFSFTTGKAGGDWLEWHMRSGYAIVTLLAFRLAWGFVGSDTARFAGFIRGPRAAWAYLRGFRRPAFAYGHNPLGGWSVVAMLAILLVQAGSGLFADDEIATQGPLAVTVSNAFVSLMSAVHAFNEWLVVGAAALHVAAVLFYQFGLRIDLLRPMFRGWSVLPEGAEPPAGRPGALALAAVLLAAAAACVFWLVTIYPRAG